MNLPIRENVLAMLPYVSGGNLAAIRQKHGLKSLIKLSANENPLGPSPLAVAAIERALGELHRYPDADAGLLRDAISKHLGVGNEWVLTGCGSDEILRLIGMITIDGKEDEVVYADPSFIVYEDIAELAPCRGVKVPVDATFAIDLEKLASAITSRTKIVFLANPNNPTGTGSKVQEFEQFVKTVPSNVLLVVDEAYYEYASQFEDHPNGLDYLPYHQNIIVLRTFSKAYGLAGLRLGYAVAHPEIIEALNRARPPFNSNSLAQVGAAAALKDHDHLQRTLEVNRAGMPIVEATLRELGGVVSASRANFVYAEFEEDTKSLADALLSRGVMVRPGHGFGRANALRVTVGTLEECEAFAEAGRSISGQFAPA